MKNCRIPGCGRPVHALGLCNAHHVRHLRGQPLRAPFRRMVCGTPEERLKAWVEVDPDTGCHIWTGHLGAGGYGRMFVAGKNPMVHRLAWELAHGPIPEGMLVLHTCDNVRCCNPEHLKLGTYKDNARERVARNRIKGCREEDLKRHPQWGDPYGAVPRVVPRKRREASPPRRAAPEPADRQGDLVRTRSAPR